MEEGKFKWSQMFEYKSGEKFFHTKAEPVRYLGWKQPFASLMLPPFNKKETRTWSTSYRGLVLITASQHAYSHTQIMDISGYVQSGRISDALGMTRIFPGLPKGKAIAIGMLCDCQPMKKEDENNCYVAFNSSLFVWTFNHVKAIEPFNMKGAQGWRKLDQETINKIKII